MNASYAALESAKDGTVRCIAQWISSSPIVDAGRYLLTGLFHLHNCTHLVYAEGQRPSHRAAAQSKEELEIFPHSHGLSSCPPRSGPNGRRVGANNRNRFAAVHWERCSGGPLSKYKALAWLEVEETLGPSPSYSDRSGLGLAGRSPLDAWPWLILPGLNAPAPGGVLPLTKQGNPSQEFIHDLQSNIYCTPRQINVFGTQLLNVAREEDTNRYRRSQLRRQSFQNESR